MYKNGLTFPIFYIFLNDNLNIHSYADLTFHKRTFFLGEESSINKSILDCINTNKGFEIYPYLLNHFLYILLTPAFISKEEITSTFIKDKTTFTSILKSTKVDFEIIENSLQEINRIAEINKEKFYNSLLKLLYKNFALKLSTVISYSDHPSSELYFNFKNDYKKVNDFLGELENTRPNLVINYEFKKAYIKSFFKSFNASNNIEIENKVEQLKNLQSSSIKNTFRQIIKESIIFNSNVTSNERNKLFKPIYSQIIYILYEKTFVDSKETQNALTKEVKRFLSLL